MLFNVCLVVKLRCLGTYIQSLRAQYLFSICSDLESCSTESIIASLLDVNLIQTYIEFELIVSA